jgi:hypothetical protein
MTWMARWLMKGEPCCPMPSTAGPNGEIFICRHRRAWRRRPPWASGGPRRDDTGQSSCWRWRWRRIPRRAALRELTAQLRQAVAAFEQPEGRR